MALLSTILGVLVVLVVGVSCQYGPVQVPDIGRVDRPLLGNIIPIDRFPAQNSGFGSSNHPVDLQTTQGGSVNLPRVVLSQAAPFRFSSQSDINFNQGSGQAAGAVFGQGVGSGQAAGAVFGQNQATVLGSGRFNQVSVPRVTIGIPEVRSVDALLTPTVTQVITIDRCVTVTDQAFNSVAVTLTSFSVQTVTVGTRAVLQTPVDDRVALQTSVFVRPGTVTLTEVKSDFRIVTETSLTHVTLAHTSYVISQYTFTTTATQVQTYTATLVRTNISTQRTTVTNYRTVTDTVFVNSAYGYRAQ
nr:uncharacterized protein LOC123766099 isoform X14 [Procambarus clarkii]